MEATCDLEALMHFEHVEALMLEFLQLKCELLVSPAN